MAYGITIHINLIDTLSIKMLLRSQKCYVKYNCWLNHLWQIDKALSDVNARIGITMVIKSCQIMPL